MDQNTQKTRLIVNGAVAFYEGQGLEIADILTAQNRPDLLTALDALTTVLYWLQAKLDLAEK